MSIGLNQVVLGGTVASQLRRSQGQSGTPAIHFNLCIERVIKGGMSRMFVPITCWGRTAECADALREGDATTVLGRLSMGKKKMPNGVGETPQLEVIADVVWPGSPSPLQAQEYQQGVQPPQSYQQTQAQPQTQQAQKQMYQQAQGYQRQAPPAGGYWDGGEFREG